ncbi:MAG TPA: hypothetical protein VEC38_05255 [Candidatus Binataceae bacterium]|nr:hypothetical protein [Candidatus Binataceae bacterium]
MRLAVQSQVSEPELDMNRNQTIRPARTGPLRFLFRRLPLFGATLDTPRRSVERKLEELYHPFD